MQRKQFSVYSNGGLIFRGTKDEAIAKAKATRVDVERSAKAGWIDSADTWRIYVTGMGFVLNV